MQARLKILRIPPIPSFKIVFFFFLFQNQLTKAFRHIVSKRPAKVARNMIRQITVSFDVVLWLCSCPGTSACKRPPIGPAGYRRSVRPPALLSDDETINSLVFIFYLFGFISKKEFHKLYSILYGSQSFRFEFFKFLDYSRV